MGLSIKMSLTIVNLVAVALMIYAAVNMIARGSLDSSDILLLLIMVGGLRTVLVEKLERQE